MSFASPSFLWYFMPTVLGLHWLLPGRWRNGVVALASLVFYAWGAGAFVLLLLASLAFVYTAGRVLSAGWIRRRPPWRAAVLATAVCGELGALGFWKYAPFGSAQLRRVAPDVPLLRVALPIGISFFTFHGLSYLVDVYRGSRTAQRNPVTFAMYMAMFPQLIAGPIVRYHEIADQLAAPPGRRWDNLAAGFPRFALGLAKKVVVADCVATIANAVFAAPPSTLDWRTAWVGALAYTVQIYFDFSGYSDMAIGLARMFGLTFPENFDRPYSAVSVTDFWRRWHTSLSRWFRDYLYIPLGGNRGGAGATYRNLVLVFIATGIWHGANWTFLVWGLYHGALLIVERVTGLNRLAADRFVVARRAVTLLLVVVGWVVFRSPSLHAALAVLRRMAVPHLAATSSLLVDSGVGNQTTVVFGAALLVFLLPRGFVMGRFLALGGGGLAAVARYGYSLLALGYVGVLVAAGSFSPFLYYQF